MRKLLLGITFIPILASCQNTIQDKTPDISNEPTTATKSPSPGKYTFGAVTYTYEDMGETKNAVLVSEVQNNYGLTENEEYQLLDYISNNVRIQTAYKHTVNQRKVYTFSSYKEASEKRQTVIKHGID